jgi:hypothetical protein
MVQPLIGTFQIGAVEVEREIGHHLPLAKAFVPAAIQPVAIRGRAGAGGGAGGGKGGGTRPLIRLGGGRGG